jgi:hypothetical protein
VSGPAPEPPTTRWECECHYPCPDCGFLIAKRGDDSRRELTDLECLRCAGVTGW